MSSTSQLTTFSDLYTDLQNRVRITAGITASQTIAQRLINIALQDVHLGLDQKFPWAERTGRLVTQAQYTTGTLSVSQGSTTLTGSGTAWNTNNAFTVHNMRAGGRIRIAGSLTPYTISSVSTDTAATLTSKFTEADQTAQTYLYFEDEYDLATDFLRPVDLRRFSPECNIGLIGRNEFRRRFPANSTPSNYPAFACINDYAPSGNTTPIRRVQLAPPPSIAQTIPYSYITNLLAVSSAGVGQTALSAATDEPIVPLRYRHVLVYHALNAWYRDQKDDTRAADAKAEYTDAMARMMADVDTGASRPSIQPNVGRYARAAQRPWRGYGEGRRYTVGSAWDEMREP